MTNHENEEQKPIPQTLCGALQKEANCKCLVLSVLIYGCLAAVTWCRCTNVTKIIINFSLNPIKSTRYVSPCEDGYIYIPVAFMGMLYLLYLVECYHSPIRIDLLHADGQGACLAKIAQLRLVQPTIWWKAISYHYVRRKRQIMRYRNGDNFTTTQVYYERVNSHAATSFYFYDYCGSKDISKELILDPKIPITKITLSKGFAFSNVRSATEFEEARSRFFAEQEFRDDYMEMREGLDLGCNFSPMTLVAVLGNPWFTRSYVYWCLSALLLSWPLRIIIECKMQYVDYQVTKLFGVNYDTPTNVQIHTSASQLSAPGSYMLAPSYSEALLMEPLPRPTADEPAPLAAPTAHTDLVPSYSEAMLYERAADEHQPLALRERPRTAAREAEGRGPPREQRGQPAAGGDTCCECPCHGMTSSPGTEAEELASSQDSLPGPELRARGGARLDGRTGDGGAAARSPRRPGRSCAAVSSLGRGRICDSCLGYAPATVPPAARRSSDGEIVAELAEAAGTARPRPRGFILREYSEPDLRRSAELPMGEGPTSFLRANGRSLENIMESEEIDNPLHPRPGSDRTPTPWPEGSTGRAPRSLGSGAIPKTTTMPVASRGGGGGGARVTVNPIAEATKRLPGSRSAYFCLKSILKQNRRRFTLVTPEELRSLTRAEEPEAGREEECDCLGCRAELERPASLGIGRSRPLSCQSLDYRRENSRTLIFASPIQAICPSDPFGGQDVVRSDNPTSQDDALDLPLLSRLRRSRTTREHSASSAVRAERAWRHRRTLSTDPHFLVPCSSDSTRNELIRSERTGPRGETAISLPSYDGLIVPPDSRNGGGATSPPSSALIADERGPFLRLDELIGASCSTALCAEYGAEAGRCELDGVQRKSRLTRSLTERRSTPESRRHDRALRKSLTERADGGCRISSVKRAINIETSL